MIAKSSTGRDDIGVFLRLSMELADNAVGRAGKTGVSNAYTLG
jgi:hypothetical protein